MAVTKITIDQFHELSDKYPVLDVRSPGEYLHAHIPGAYSLPLFTDDERKVVGTAYKQQSKQIAIKTGLKYFGGKMVRLIDEAEKIVESCIQKTPQESEQKTVIVHCWRGGMRSAGIAWLLDLYGFKVHTLVGGYKSFRRWCTSQFNKEYPFNILGGYTGSGKTEILKEISLDGIKTIDLEALANHKGSAFGYLGQQTQPSQEMFENKLAIALSTLEENSIWLEDESQRIGSVSIPTVLYNYIQRRPLYFLEIPFEQRLKYITDSYGIFKKEELAAPITRITKRLGGLETKTALEYLEAGDIYNCFRILLRYYDKYYLQCLHQKKGKALFIKSISLNDTNASANAQALLSMENAEEEIVSKLFGE